MISMKNNSIVSLIANKTIQQYPSEAPYNPPEKYPEFSYDSPVNTNNTVYGMVRKLLHQLDLDSENYDSPRWNPFQELVKVGGTVVIKPNLVKHEHRLGDEGVISTLTHGSVIRPLVDYTYKAVGDSGKIIIGDNPYDHSDWDEMMRVTGIGAMVEILANERGYPVEIMDFRKFSAKILPGQHIIRKEVNGDPLGYVLINLGDQSEFHELDNNKQNYHTLADRSVNHYDPFTKEIGVPNNYHFSGKHEYLIGKSVLSSDLFINVPKMKTHGKAGVTLSLKNLIGIVSGKQYLPHHRPGNKPKGDAFPKPPNATFVKHRLQRKNIAEAFSWIYRLFPQSFADAIAKFGRKFILEKTWPVKPYEKDRIEWGDWSGNDTIWRTILDLNRILIYGDSEGQLSKTPQRSYFSLIDGIIAQEGHGPTDGDPFHAGTLIGGFNPVYVDAVACLIMGFDPRKIRLMNKTNEIKDYWIGNTNFNDIQVVTNNELPRFHFSAPGGSEIAWKGKIEVDSDELLGSLNVVSAI